MTPLGSRSLDDPTALRVLAALGAVGEGRSAVTLPAMDATFRDELRTQLVAVTPRLVAEGVHPETEGRPARAARRAGAEAPRPVARTRPMTALLAGAAVVVLGLGGATWLARGALPGDPLYGLKRTAESVDVSLSGSDLDKGHALLADAQKRVDEANALLDRPQALALGSGPVAAGAISTSTSDLLVATLAAADDDTHAGITRIGDDAIGRGDTSGLELVVGWAQGQRDRLDALVGRIPAGAAHDRAEASADEIRAGLQRATALLADHTNSSCTRGRDAFGPTPCLSVPAPTPAPSSGASSGTGSGSGTGGSSTGGTGGSGSTNGTSGATIPGAPAPPSTSLPTPATSALPTGGGAVGSSLPASVAPPVAVDSCGLQVSLPVAGVSLGTCTPSR